MFWLIYLKEIKEKLIKSLFTTYRCILGLLIKLLLNMLQILESLEFLNSFEIVNNFYIFKRQKKKII